MRQITEVMRLNAQGLSYRQIAQSVGISAAPCATRSLAASDIRLNSTPPLLGSASRGPTRGERARSFPRQRW